MRSKRDGKSGAGLWKKRGGAMESSGVIWKVLKQGFRIGGLAGQGKLKPVILDGCRELVFCFWFDIKNRGNAALWIFWLESYLFGHLFLTYLSYLQTFFWIFAILLVRIIYELNFVVHVKDFLFFKRFWWIFLIFFKSNFFSPNCFLILF